MKRTFWQEDQAVLKSENGGKMEVNISEYFKSGSGGLSKSMFPMDSSGKLDILTNLGKK